jgi:hypothetical protein
LQFEWDEVHLEIGRRAIVQNQQTMDQRPRQALSFVFCHFQFLTTKTKEVNEDAFAGIPRPTSV